MNEVEEKLIAHVRQGHFATIAEYRFSKAEMLNWRDKATGQPRSAPTLRHTVEMGDQAVAVSESLPQNISRLEDVPPPKFRKGDIVILTITELTRDRGLVSCRGTLEATNGTLSPGTSAPVSADKTVKR